MFKVWRYAVKALRIIAERYIQFCDEEPASMLARKGDENFSGGIFMSSWGNVCKAMSAKLKAEAKRIKREEALNNAPEKASSNNKYTAPQATPKSCPSCGQGSAIYIDSCGHCGYSWA